MNAHTKIPSDIIGLITPAPVSRRGFFMTASAAAAAGYTLAAGPVRAQVVTTDTKGLKAGDATVKVAGGDMPVYWARPEKGSNHPVVIVAMEIFGLHEYIKDVTRRLAKAGAFAIAPNYYFRSGEDLTKITEIPKLMPIVNGKPNWKDSDPVWQKIGQAGKQVGLEWAGEWKTFKETAHFQYTGGKTLKQLQAGEKII